jgi:hypothetical protein
MLANVRVWGEVRGNGEVYKGGGSKAADEMQGREARKDIPTSTLQLS